MPEPEMITLEIDDTVVSVPVGTTVWEADDFVDFEKKHSLGEWISSSGYTGVQMLG